MKEAVGAADGDLVVGLRETVGATDGDLVVGLRETVGPAVGAARLQLASEVAAVAAESFPTGQLVHTVAPTAPLYVPAGHAWHAPDCR